MVFTVFRKDYFSIGFTFESSTELIPQNMKIYYVTTFHLLNEAHILHKEGCKYLPTFLSRKFLGHFPSYEEALKESNKIYSTAIVCPFCINEKLFTNKS